MRTTRILLYGFLVWLMPFVVALALGGVKAKNRVFFESIMPVVLTLTVIVFLTLDFQAIAGGYLKRALRLGIVWLAISIALDLAMFSSGPVRMSFTDYMQDIGLTYLIIPIVTIGVGRLADQLARPKHIAEAGSPPP